MAREGKERQCVAIARDALKQIKDEKYIATHGTYGLGSLGGLSLNKIEFQAEVKKIKQCRVCAIGALFVSLVRKYDDCTSRSNKWRKLCEFFKPIEVSNIEDYFEGWGMYGDFEPRHGSGNPRLKKILNNIIENKGHFIAPKEKP